MDPKLTELLMKARKGATSSFSTRNWIDVLEALGFHVTAEKSGNTVVSVTITAPHGQTLEILKQPCYKHILFYDVPRWLQECGPSLEKMASDALGMEGPSEERERRALEARDLTHTGTCGICTMNVKMDGDGTLWVHGYIRPGTGTIHRVCPGAHYEPNEVSPRAIENYIRRLEKAILQESSFLGRLRDGSIDALRVEVRKEGRRVEVEVRPSDGRVFADALETEIRKSQWRLAQLQTDRSHFAKELANWKPGVLPEEMMRRRSRG